MMEHFLLGLTSIIILGVGAQWIAWRFKMPSIVVLLVFGFFAGGVFGILQPEELFGNSFMPAISIAVAIILFEGGLNLRWKEVREVQKPVRNLITIGSGITWVLISISAHYILDLNLALSVLLGAILISSGTTVIIPLLRHIKPTKTVNSVLKWEGVLTDPIGAFLAVFTFEILFAGSRNFNSPAFFEIIQTLGVGAISGVAGAGIVVLALKRYWIPYFLNNPMTLMLVLTVFTVSDAIQAESGLFAVLIMGSVLANQQKVSVKHIMEFKENLQVLLIGGLFIVLAAQLTLDDLALINGKAFAFLAVLILLVRPIAVFISMRSSDLSFKIKAFLSIMAPRGIIAAAVASIFALRLKAIDYPGAELLVPLVFFVIIGTVTIYGLISLPVAKSLKISNTGSQGVLILGAHEWARSTGKMLKDEGIEALFLDSNWDNISAARMEGFDAVYTNILSEHTIDDMDLGSIGYMLALTSNDQINTMACMRFSGILGRANVYQLAPREKAGSRRHEISPHLRGKFLGETKLTYPKLNQTFLDGYKIKTITLSKNFGYKRFLHEYDLKAIPLFIIDETKKLAFISEGANIKPKAGQKIISIVPGQ